MWKPIPGWEGKYMVNEFGDVKSVSSGHLLVGDVNSAGYQRVRCYDGRKSERFFRHRLVASLFVPNPNGYKEVNHIDHNKDNNSADNLEWCDRTYNERDKKRFYTEYYRPFVVEFMNGTIKKI